MATKKTSTTKTTKPKTTKAKAKSPAKTTKTTPPQPQPAKPVQIPPVPVLTTLRESARYLSVNVWSFAWMSLLLLLSLVLPTILAVQILPDDVRALATSMNAMNIMGQQNPETMTAITFSSMIMLAGGLLTSFLAVNFYVKWVRFVALDERPTFSPGYLFKSEVLTTAGLFWRSVLVILALGAFLYPISLAPALPELVKGAVLLAFVILLIVALVAGGLILPQTATGEYDNLSDAFRRTARHMVRSLVILAALILAWNGLLWLAESFVQPSLPPKIALALELAIHVVMFSLISIATGLMYGWARDGKMLRA